MTELFRICDNVIDPAQEQSKITTLIALDVQI
jgi:hypothetical protein